MSSGFGSTGSNEAGTVQVVARNDETATAPERVVVLKIRRREQVKAGILKEYFCAAERGQISFLKYYRIRRGMDQAQLAERAGVTQPEIARAERPGYLLGMRGRNLKRLATALGVTVDDLLR